MRSSIGVAGVGRLVEQRGEIGLPPIGDAVHALAVDAISNSLRILEPAHDVQVRAIELRLELVLGVERERVADAEAADRAERQPVDVLVLREVLRHAVGVAARPRCSGSPTASALIFAAARQIALVQRRRDAEHVRDVVEAVGRIVGRQQRRRRRRRARADRGWRSRTRRGSGDAAAAGRDSDVRPRRDRAPCSSHATSACVVASSGRRAPCGGITPARSLRTTFSQISASPDRRDRSSPSSTRPPVFRRALWQVTQYLFDDGAVGRTRGCGLGRDGLPAGGFGRKGCKHEPAARGQRQESPEHRSQIGRRYYARFSARRACRTECRDSGFGLP